MHYYAHLNAASSETPSQCCQPQGDWPNGWRSNQTKCKMQCVLPRRTLATYPFLCCHSFNLRTQITFPFASTREIATESASDVSKQWQICAHFTTEGWHAMKLQVHQQKQRLALQVSHCQFIWGMATIFFFVGNRNTIEVEFIKYIHKK